MSNPYKLSQSDIDSIEEGICPICQSQLEVLDECSYRCNECDASFYLLPHGHGVFPYECLDCSHTMLGITQPSYEAMICPKCSNKTLLRVVNIEEL